MNISEDIKHQILKIIFKYIKSEEVTVVVFGSYAQGTARQSSDIDIGIFPNPKLTSLEVYRIKSDLEENVKTLRDIDLVDFTSNLDEDFKRIALEEIIVWHKGKESKNF